MNWNSREHQKIVLGQRDPGHRRPRVTGQEGQISITDFTVLPWTNPVAHCNAKYSSNVLSIQINPVSFYTSKVLY